MKKKPDLNVNGTVVRVLNIEGADYICISDIAMLKNSVEPKDVVKNWMRTRATISFLGLWEKLHNPDFKGVEFDPLLKIAGDNAFTMSPTRWVSEFNAHGSQAMKQAGWVKTWIELHQDELAANWEIAQKGGEVYKINPLEK